MFILSLITRSSSALVRSSRTTWTKPISSSLFTTTTRLDASNNNNNNNNKDGAAGWMPPLVDDFIGAAGEDNNMSGYARPVIQWYPGHIAKAERLLKETFQAVDVVVEVRDARASTATSHPKVAQWSSGRPRLVVFTHVDMVPSATHRAWKQHYETTTAQPTEKGNNKKVVAGTIPDHFLWVNAKQGQGIQALHRAIFKAGAHVQERRQRRGLKDRPLRVGIMGYPNVGKSALINRLLGKRRARTANTPGVTRALQWIRVRTDDAKKTNKKEYELLDSPGIIPASLENQADALLLAACHCIGEAAYDNQVVAAYLCQWMQSLLVQGHADVAAPKWRQQCKNRWGVDPLKLANDDTMERYSTGEELLYQVADNTCKGSAEDASRKILQDFRAGRMGPICLQAAPERVLAQDHNNNNNNNIPDPRMGTLRNVMVGQSASEEQWQRLLEQQHADQLERVKVARETAKERGLELPPKLEKNNAPITDDSSSTETPDDVGKGLFDGW